MRPLLAFVIAVAALCCVLPEAVVAEDPNRATVLTVAGIINPGVARTYYKQKAKPFIKAATDRKSDEKRYRDAAKIDQQPCDMAAHLTYWALTGHKVLVNKSPNWISRSSHLEDALAAPNHALDTKAKIKAKLDLPGAHLFAGCEAAGCGHYFTISSYACADHNQCAALYQAYADSETPGRELVYPLCNYIFGVDYETEVAHNKITSHPPQFYDGSADGLADALFATIGNGAGVQAAIQHIFGYAHAAAGYTKYVEIAHHAFDVRNLATYDVPDISKCTRDNIVEDDEDFFLEENASILRSNH